MAKALRIKKDGTIDGRCLPKAWAKRSATRQSIKDEAAIVVARKDALKLNIKPAINCPQCRISRQMGKVVWCSCIYRKIALDNGVQFGSECS